MIDWLQSCHAWLEGAYRGVPNDFAGTSAEFRWVDARDLMQEASPESSGVLALSDVEIGWLFFFLPYSRNLKIEPWINQALRIRARLAREANYTGNKEPSTDEDRDAWQVGLIWLVAQDDKDIWQAEMATLRHQSGASEEISFDRVLIGNDGVTAALNRHTLPRLLLTSRQLLRKTADQVESWLSADAQVADQLDGFSGRFDSPLARSHARWLEEQATTHEVRPSVVTQKQHKFEGFSVENFRNLKKFEVAAVAEDTGNAVGSIVLFGPNGTGKSSLIEALSLAAFNRVQRSDDYHRDKDITRPSGERFLTSYVTPLNGKECQPGYHWGNGETKSFEVLALEQAGNPDGVILDQDQSRDFTNLKADDLAARVLHGYSELAQRLSDELDRRAESANQEKLNFLREFGLSGNISKTESAYKALAEFVLRQIKPIPSGFSDWAERIGHLSDPVAYAAKELAIRWNQFRERPNSTAESIAKLQGVGAGTEILSSSIKELVELYNRLAEETRTLLEKWEERYAELKNSQIDLFNRMDDWGDFLARPTEPSQATTEEESLRKELERFALDRSKTEQHGKEAAARLELLERTLTYLQSHWASEHTDTCPVCASQIDDVAGIEAVVRAIESECRRERDDLRARYLASGKQLHELEGQLKSLSAAVCPVPATDQEKLRVLLSPFLGNENLESLLMDRQRREHLKADMRYATRLLSKPENYPDPALEAQRLAEEFQKKCDVADAVLAEPQAVDEVRKAYQSILREVLEQHLPETLGRVWQEIAHCLTAAHWLLPETPSMKLERGRGRQSHRLSLKVGDTDRIARYFYNAAELHTLGLAWFFTLHLARRRFEYAWIALDDPAQDLDQTSFRELCRFLATWQRMYRRAKQPHTLLIALHQEERALDVTRATDAQLYLLGWNEKQSEEGPTSPDVRRQVLLTPGYHPKLPTVLFTSSLSNTPEH